MQTDTRIPTLDDIKRILSTRDNQIGFGAHRTAYREPNSRWVVKVDYDSGATNRNEYKNAQRVRPSLSNPSLRIPEMHMVGNYLIAEYVEGSPGGYDCWNTRGDRRNGKAYYNAGCADPNCANGDNCWAEVTRELSNTVADIHHSNVLITKDNVVYVIDLGEH